MLVIIEAEAPTVELLQWSVITLMLASAAQRFS